MTDRYLRGRAAWLRGGHLTTASLEFGGENELSECPSSAAIIGVGLVGGNERGSRGSKRNTAGIKIKNTTLGIDLTPPQKTGFMGRGEIDSQSGILNFYSGVITDWMTLYAISTISG